MLLTEARATSYQHSPLPFSDRELLRGAALPGALRVLPQGERGRTRRARGQPAALASVLGPALFDNRLEGELHWRVAHGGDARRTHRPCRPGAALSDDDIWRVLDYLRLQAYGLSGGAGMPAVPAPAVALSCRDGRAAWLTDLRGLPVRVLAPGSPEPQDPRLLTVALSRDGAPVADADCVATGPQAWAAYALAAGLPRMGWPARNSWWTGAAGCARLPGARAGLDQRRQRLRPRRPHGECSAGPGRAAGRLWTASPSPFPISGALRKEQASDARHAHRS